MWGDTVVSLSVPGPRPSVVKFRTSPSLITFAVVALSLDPVSITSPLRSVIFGAALRSTRGGSLIVWACWCVPKVEQGAEGFQPSSREIVFSDKVLRRTMFTLAKTRLRFSFAPQCLH